MGGEHDGPYLPSTEILDTGPNPGKRGGEDGDVVVVPGGFLQHRHLQRERLPAVLGQLDAQRRSDLRPVGMKPAPVQHDDRPARSVAIGFGVDAEERVTVGIEVHRLAVEDRIDDLRFEPALPLEVLGGCRRREGRGACNRRRAQQRGVPARPCTGATARRSAPRSIPCHAGAAQKHRVPACDIEYSDTSRRPAHSRTSGDQLIHGPPARVGKEPAPRRRFGQRFGGKRLRVGGAGAEIEWFHQKEVPVPVRGRPRMLPRITAEGNGRATQSSESVFTRAAGTPRSISRSLHAPASPCGPAT